jgi:hypothetical protein
VNLAKLYDRYATMNTADLLNDRVIPFLMLDYILGTHPITTKGTSRFGRRSDEALWINVYMKAPWFFKRVFFSAILFSVGFVSFQSDFLTGMDQSVEDGFTDDRTFKQLEPTLGFDASATILRDDIFGLGGSTKCSGMIIVMLGIGFNRSNQVIN